MSGSTTPGERRGSPEESRESAERPPESSPGAMRDAANERMGRSAYGLCRSAGSARRTASAAAGSWLGRITSPGIRSRSARTLA